MPIVHINQKYRILEKYIASLDVKGFYLSSPALTLYRGRNTLRLFKRENIEFVVKSFEHTLLLNKYVYGLRIRQPKAERAYRNAEQLLRLGLSTPTPIATVEVRSGGRLVRSYFSYAYSHLEPLKHIEERFQQLEPEEQDFWVEQITAYLMELHGKGVYHKDLHLNNVLFEKDGDGVMRFQLIDINRMRFLRSISAKRRLKNLAHVSDDRVLLERLTQAYAEKNGIRDGILQGELRRRHRSEHVYKPIRHFFKRLFGRKRHGK